jgi:hypothetical protein
MRRCESTIGRSKNDGREEGEEKQRRPIGDIKRKRKRRGEKSSAKIKTKRERTERYKKGTSKKIKVKEN